MTSLHRSVHDREIVRIATLSLGTVAAAPLMVVVDTAIVGHLGKSQLAALAVAGAILITTFNLSNFLMYATVAVVSRASGGARAERLQELANAVLWISLSLGAVAAVAWQALAEPVVHALVGDGHVGHLAVLYLRIAAIGLPGAFVMLAGQGYLRGTASLQRPFVIIGLASFANLVLELLFVYVFHWGMAGAAAGTAIAQLGMGAAFAVSLGRAAGRIRRPRIAEVRPMLTISRQIFIRTGVIVLSYFALPAVIARMGEVQLAAHHIVFQLFTLIGLSLESVAIAGQVLVGRLLGANDPDGAFAVARRVVVVSAAAGTGFAVVLLALTDVLPRAFSDDPDVVDAATRIWPFLALMMPVGAVAWALDGILIGAADTSFLMWAMLAGCGGVLLPVTFLSLSFDWGLIGVWSGLAGLMFARFTLLGARFARRRWLVPGWHARDHLAVHKALEVSK